MSTEPALPTPTRLLVLGAGSVGCFVGGNLQDAGLAVQWVGRPRNCGRLCRNPGFDAAQR